MCECVCVCVCVCVFGSEVGEGMGNEKRYFITLWKLIFCNLETE